MISECLSETSSDFLYIADISPHYRTNRYAGALPLVVNLTVLNGMGVAGRLEGPPSFQATDEGGAHLHVDFMHSEVGARGRGKGPVPHMPWAFPFNP